MNGYTFALITTAGICAAVALYTLGEIYRRKLNDARKSAWEMHAMFLKSQIELRRMTGHADYWRDRASEYAVQVKRRDDAASARGRHAALCGVEKRRAPIEAKAAELRAWVDAGKPGVVA